MMFESIGISRNQSWAFTAVAFIAISIHLSSAAAEDRITPLGAIGNEDNVWVYRTVPAAKADDSRVTFTYGQSFDSGLRFRVFQGDGFRGYIAACAIRGNNLHVFYRDGSHYRLRYVQRTVSEPPRDNDFRELTAPGDVVPMAVYGDTDADAVYAIVPTRSVMKLPLHVQPLTDQTIDATTNGETTRVPRVTAASVIDSSQTQSLHSLVRYHHAEWQFVTLCPGEIESAANMWLATENDTFAILFAPAVSKNSLRLSVGTIDSWQPATNGPSVDPSGVIGFFCNRNVFTAITQKSEVESAPPIIEAHQWLDGVWKPGDGMEFNLDPTHKFGDEVTASRYGQGVVLAYELKTEDSTRVWTGVWPVAGGAPLVEPAEVPALNQDSNLSSSSQRISIGIAVLLSALLFVVFVRRTPSLFVEMETPSGYALAGSWKRLMAFSIDLFVVALIAFPLFVAPWMTANFSPGDDIQRELSFLMEYDQNAAFAPWTKSLLLFVVYAAAMEIACRATIGKLILGLRVCSTTGNQCSPLAIVIRNCLRFELYYKLSFLPLAMLIILTRNHQRLGDLVAGTLVIERQKPETKS